LSLFKELKRRNVFKVATVYIIVGWLVMQAGGVMGPALHLPGWVDSVLAFFLILGFPLALIFAWAFEMTPEGLKKEKDIDPSQSVVRATGKKLNYTIIALLLVVAGITYGLIVSLDDVVEVEPASVNRMAFPLPDKPSIAVLPFDNMSGDTEQEYFVDGMTEDLITDLSRISGLFVIARNSVFTYKNKPVKVQQVAEELGVRYVLEGSVRKIGDSVRINAQLIDAVTGGHVWAERYDDNTEDIFALQDRITQRIVSALELTLTQAEQSVERGTTSPEAHDAFLRGWAHFRRNTPEAFAKAVPYFQKAIKIDPSYRQANAALASIYWKVLDKTLSTRNDAWVAFQEISWGEANERFIDNINRAMEDPGALAYQAMAFRYTMQGRHDKAVNEARHAIAVDPNNPIGYETLAAILIYLGRPGDGEEAIREAMRLDPRYPYEYLFWLGLAQFNMEEFEQAVETLRLATQGNPEDDRSLIVLAAAYGQLGRIEEAQFAMEAQNQVRKIRGEQRPDRDNSRVGVIGLTRGPYTLEDVDLWLYQESSDRERLRKGLRVAGVPETGDGTTVSPLFVPGASSIDVLEAKQLYDRGVVFIDARPVADWSTSHINGAIPLDFETNFTKESLSDVINLEIPAVIYCQGPRCLRSSKAVEKAVSWGFTNIYYFRDGYPAWKIAGFPFESE